MIRPYKSLIALLGALCIIPPSVVADGAPQTPPPAITAPDTPTLVDISLDWNAGSNNISRELKLKADPINRTLIFTQLALEDFSPIRNVEVRTGQDYAAGMSHSGISLDAPKPAVWNFVVDVSGMTVAREQAISAELQTVLRIMSDIPEKDHVCLYTIASDVEKWGTATNASDREKLISSINTRLRNKEYGDKLSFRKSSFIYAGLRKVISWSSVTPERKHLIVLLSDGNDETGGDSSAASGDRANAQGRVVQEATNAGIPIHTLAFAQSSNDRGGFPHLYNLSRETNGLNFAAALHTFEFPNSTNIPRQLLLNTHPCTGKLTVQLAESIDNVRVILSGDSGCSGYVSIAKESIVFPPAQPAPAPAPVADSEEKTALLALLTKLDELHGKLEELKQKENATPAATAETLQPVVVAIEEMLRSVTPEANTLKAKDIAKIREASEQLQAAADVAPQRKEYAKKLLKLFDNHPTDITDAELLALLGRTSPLPKPIGEGPRGDDANLYVLSAVAGALLLLALIVVFLICKKKNEIPPPPPSPWDSSTTDNTPATTDDGIGNGQGRVSAIRPVLCELYSVRDNRSWQLHKPTATIGRDDSNDITIPNTSVSSRHCVLNLNRDGKWELRDLGSANGIYAADSLLTSVELCDGCEFELGEVLLRFHDCRNK